MIITCGECKKKFVVPDNAIPAGGRTVQCSACSNEWRQFPVKKTKDVVKSAPIATKKTVAPIKKKIAKKRKSPVPYSKEYLQQKWGVTIKDYAEKEKLNKKSFKKSPAKKSENISLGFFNYVIVFFVLSTFLIGILNFERSRLTRKFPFLEPYIDHFFETLNNFKIFILDFFR